MAKNYVAPDYMKEAFTCPHCGTLSLMHKICVSFKGASAITMAPNLRQGTNWVEIASCQNCKKKTIYAQGMHSRFFNLCPNG